MPSISDTACPDLAKSVPLTISMSSGSSHATPTLDECQRLAEAGDIDGAIQGIRDLVDETIDDAGTLNALGEMLASLGRIVEGAEAFRRAVQADPENRTSQLNLAAADTHLGHYEQAKIRCESLLRSNPEFAPAYQQLARICHVQSDFGNAIRNLREVIRLQPANATAHANLGATLQFQGRFERAEQQYRKALDLDPGQLDALCNFGMLCLQLGRGKEARKFLNQALETCPNHPTALAGLAECMCVFGDYQLAADLLLPTIGRSQITPNLAVAYSHTQVALGAAKNALPVIERALALPNLTPVSIVQLRFALGDVHDQLGDHELAFDNYKTANESSGVVYDRAGEERTVHNLISAFAAKDFEKLPRAANTCDVPVFVVGLPRSGKSLTEQILASHPAVYGAGELPIIERISAALKEATRSNDDYPWCIRNTDANTLGNFAEQYLQQIQPDDADATRIVDTTPGNYRHVGLIRLLFPAAKIVHCVRDPLDLVISCYSKNYAGRRLAFSFDLENTAHYVLLYKKLMQHWENTCAIPLMTIRYEDLVTRTQQMAQELIRFLGLDWNPACLDYYRDGAASLATDERTHEPLIDREVGRWKNYYEFFGPVKRMLVADTADKG